MWLLVPMLQTTQVTKTKWRQNDIVMVMFMVSLFYIHYIVQSTFLLPVHVGISNQIDFSSDWRNTIHVTTANRHCGASVFGFTCRVSWVWTSVNVSCTSSANRKMYWWSDWRICEKHILHVWQTLLNLLQKKMKISERETWTFWTVIEHDNTLLTAWTGPLVLYKSLLSQYGKHVRTNRRRFTPALHFQQCFWKRVDRNKKREESRQIKGKNRWRMTTPQIDQTVLDSPADSSIKQYLPHPCCCPPCFLFALEKKK